MAVKFIGVCKKLFSRSFREFVRRHSSRVGKDVCERLTKELDKALEKVENPGGLLGVALWRIYMVANLFGVASGVGLYMDMEKLDDYVRNGSWHMPNWMDKELLKRFVASVQPCFYAQFLPKDLFGDRFTRP